MQNDKDTPLLKYLILDRDADLAPTDLVPDGTLIDRLYNLFNSPGPGTLTFAATQITILIHLAPELVDKPQLIITEGLKMLPGTKVLTDTYPSIPIDTAENQLKDFAHERMQSEQGPAREFERLVKEGKKEFLPREEKTTSAGNDEPEEKI